MPYLVCPECRGGLGLRVRTEQAGEILEGSLDCEPCGRAYELRGGIPRLLPRELSQEKHATASAFGYEWTHFTELTEHYRQEFLDWIQPVSPEFFAGKVVLDAGCGKGRHAYLSASFGALEVIAVDLSDAVEAAYHNTRHLPNVHVLQADIYHLPFLQPFDYAYSIGVIHHLPDPRQGFFSVLRHVKAGGRVSVWVYGKEGNAWIVKLVDPVRIHLTSRAPKPVTRALSLALAVPLYLALKLVYGPVNRSPALRPLGKLLFYSDYLAAISDFSFAENYWNVFDHLVAPTAFYLSRDQVEEWFAAKNLEAVEITQRNRPCWRGTAAIPSKSTAA